MMQKKKSIGLICSSYHGVLGEGGGQRKVLSFVRTGENEKN